MLLLCFGASSGVASLVVFALFVSSMVGTAPANYATPQFLWGAIVALSYWIMRMWLLTVRGLMNDDPILYAARDRASLILRRSDRGLRARRPTRAAMMQKSDLLGPSDCRRPDVHEPAFADEVPALLRRNGPSIAYGLGRSYGDVCLNDGGSLIRMHRLDRIHQRRLEARRHPRRGRLEPRRPPPPCRAKGWFLPVTPGHEIRHPRRRRRQRRARQEPRDRRHLRLPRARARPVALDRRDPRARARAATPRCSPRPSAGWG